MRPQRSTSPAAQNLVLAGTTSRSASDLCTTGRRSGSPGGHDAGEAVGTCAGVASEVEELFLDGRVRRGVGGASSSSSSLKAGPDRRPRQPRDRPASRCFCCNISSSNGAEVLRTPAPGFQLLQLLFDDPGWVGRKKRRGRGRKRLGRGSGGRCPLARRPRGLDVGSGSSGSSSISHNSGSVAGSSGIIGRLPQKELLLPNSQVGVLHLFHGLLQLSGGGKHALVQDAPRRDALLEQERCFKKNYLSLDGVASLFCLSFPPASLSLPPSRARASGQALASKKKNKKKIRGEKQNKKQKTHPRRPRPSATSLPIFRSFFFFLFFLLSLSLFLSPTALSLAQESKQSGGGGRSHFLKI